MTEVLSTGAAAPDVPAAAKETAPAPTGIALLLKAVVQDETGGVVPKAKVKLLNKATQKTESATTKENGEFQFTLEPQGEYVVSIKAKGFEESQTEIKPGSGGPLPARFLLQLEDAAVELTVSDKVLSAPLASEAVDSVNVSDGLIRDLPGKNGDPLALPLLFANPAVTGGASPKLVVDGVEGEAFEGPTTSIKQVSTNESPYGAEYSSPGRGRIKVLTNKSTLGRYKGNLTAYLRNSALSARNAFAAERPLRQRGVVDGAVEGPVPFTNLFSFLTALEYDHDTERVVVNAITPSGRVVENVPAPERKTAAFARVFYRSPSRSQKAMLTYSYKNKTQDNRGVGGFQLAELGRDVFAHENELKFDHSMITSSFLLNQFSVALKQQRDDMSSVAPGPRQIVLDAFSAGGAQVDERTRLSGATLQDSMSFNRGIHTFRFGGSAKARKLRTSDASNFGGTYRFSSLADFLNRTPYVFTRNIGDPAVSFGHHEFASFVQDDIRLRPNFSLYLGLRHEAQTDVDRIANFAPRFGLAYSPGGRQTVLRAGAGIFYDRQPVDLERRSLLYDGSRIRQIVLRNPSFPVALDPAGALPFALPSVERLDRARLPYLFQSSIGIDQKIGFGVLSVEGLTLRGVHLYRTRNINAPFAPGVRPDPAIVNINQFETTGTSRGNALTITFKGQRKPKTDLGKMDLLVQYTLSRTMDDTGDLFRLPANNYDLRPEWGRSDFDRRHRFNVAGTFRLPVDLRLGWVASWYSGSPYDIITGRDENGDTVANDRPLGGTRNTGRGPGFANIDARLARDFKFGPDQKLEARFGIDAFNVLNQVSFRNFIGTQTSPFFGRANAAYGARELQLSLRVKF